MKQNGVKSPWLVPAPPPPTQANNGLAALWEGSLGPWQDAEAQGGAGLSAGRGGRLQPRLRAHLLPAHLPVPPEATANLGRDRGPRPHPCPPRDVAENTHGLAAGDSCTGLAPAYGLPEHETCTRPA